MIYEKKIKINFIDFWNRFDYKEFYAYQVLNEKYDVIISDKPDYIFYSCFGNKNLEYNCIKIFYTGENIHPDFNLCDYAIGFDYLEFEDRYIRYPLYLMINNYLSSLKAASKRESTYIGNKKFCNFIVSNGESKVRNLFYDKLSQYKRVDSGGKFKI